MVSPQLKKVFADFATRWSRSLITLAGLVIGISAVIAIASTFIILSDDLTENYVRTNPHNVQAYLGNLSPSQVQELVGIPGVAEVEERRRVPARVEVREGSWFTVLLFVVEDFNDMRIDRIDPESGAWPAADGEVLFERDGRYFLPPGFGSEMRFRLRDGKIKTLKYTGNVHDAGQAPSRMERVLYGYITRATYDSWNLENPTTNVLFTVADADADAAPDESQSPSPHGPAPTESRVEFVANHLRPIMDYWNVQFHWANINDAAKHPHQFQMNSILGLLSGLLVTALVLCGALTINLIDSVLAAEVKQIGVMKAIGGRRGQIVRAYLLGMAALGAIAAVIGLSFALDLGRGTAEFIARFINFELLTDSLPVWLAPTMLLFGLAVPLLLTWWRVERAIRKPVRVALQNDEHIQLNDAPLRIAGLVKWLPLVPRMALRNIFRSPRRTLLTVVMVVVGVVAFMMAVNIRSSLMDTVDEVQRSQLSDIKAVLRDPVDKNETSNWLSQYNEVKAVEYWNVRSSRLYAVGETIGRGQNIQFIPDDSAMLVPDMMVGDWVSEDRPSGIVVSNMIYLESVDVEIGSVFDIEVNGKRATTTVVGVVKEFGGGVIYATEGLAEELGISPDTSNLVVIALRDSSIEAQSRFGQTIEAAMMEDGWNVSNIVTTGNLEFVVRGHVDIIAVVLEIVAAVMLVVCALGLASSTSVSVMERTREIGILKAVGGRSGVVRAVFMWEAVFIALIGWALSFLIAPWPSEVVATNFGLLLVQYPFNYKAAEYGAVIAAAIAVGIAVLASFLPAHSATRATVSSAIQSV